MQNVLAAAGRNGKRRKSLSAKEDGIISRDKGLLVRLEPYFQENTLLAFRKTALEEMTPADVASELGMTRHAVIVARCAVLGKLRELAGDFLA